MKSERIGWMKKDSYEISDNELEGVSGGKGGPQMMPFRCPYCDHRFQIDARKNIVICPKSDGGCGKTIRIDG
ncbi:MAG: hypothetical protein K6F35_03540 [Lachnospiraceae bacterium]|nr:hypothetical protein [Lachnospiraceae bacterium]